MKKALIFAVLTALLVTSLCIYTSAENEVEVYVTVSDSSLAVTMQKITVTDIDSDGRLTINDALYATHETCFEGGASAGYAAENGDYGLAVTKLWGVVNGGSYGYYVNNASAYSLTDEVQNGDYIYAFVYTDTVNFSDTYCYFDKNSQNVGLGDEFTLTLYASGYDENWAPVVLPVANAVILTNGKESGYVTNSEGKVTLKFDSSQSVVISAKSSSFNITPPVCRVTVTNKTAQPGDAGIIFYALLAVAALMSCLALLRKKVYEN